MASNILRLAAQSSLFASLLLLGACGPEQENPEKENQAHNACAATGENLIRDTRFTTLFSNYSNRQWHSSEHAAGKTYEALVADGILSITGMGEEPWFLVAQSADAKTLAGNTLAFSAEIKLELRESQNPHAFGYGGGLSVTAKRGGKLVVNSSMEHEPNFGVHDWQPVKIFFQLPKNSTSLRVGFVHQAGGSIQVRNPALYVVEPTCPVTVGGKNKSDQRQPGRPSDLGRLSTGQ